VLNGESQLGQKLREVELSKIYGVSNSVVREAFHLGAIGCPSSAVPPSMACGTSTWLCPRPRNVLHCEELFRFSVFKKTLTSMST